MGILAQGILKRDLGANVPTQPHNRRPLSKIFFLFYSYKGIK